MNYILVINPGSTSTKLSVFQEEKEIKSHTILHSMDDLEKFDHIVDQFDFRLNLIKSWLKEENIKMNSLRAVVGRGGLLKPVPSGTYLITDKVIEDLKTAEQGEHASNLGGLLARGIADIIGADSYFVDPVSVDEFHELSRISGLKEIPRTSLLHALNIKRVMHKRAGELNKKVEDLNFIVGHLGGGISIAAVQKGKIIDVNNANHGGPFSPERAGSLPVGDLVKLCYSNKYTYEELKSMIQGKGGLYSYLGTTDARQVYDRILNGNEYAKSIYDAMAYQIGKEIVYTAPVLYGEVDNIILTGGLANSKYLVDKISQMVSFVSKILIYPGESEMEALNMGVLRVVNNIEKHKIYEEEVVSWQKTLVRC